MSNDRQANEGRCVVSDAGLMDQLEAHRLVVEEYRLARAVEKEQSDYIRDLKAQLARVRAVVPVLQEGARYCNENDRHPERAGGIEWALGKLEAALQSAAGPGGNQPKVDNPQSEG